MRSEILLLILSGFISFESVSAESWYTSSQNAIDSLRKGDFFLELIDESGKPIETSITYELVTHEFPWGTALNLGSGSDEEWYRPMARKLFNCGVFENAFKWSVMQPTQDPPNYATVDDYLQWAEGVGWNLRGHTLLWGSKSYDDFHPLQKWVKDLSISEQLKQCELRVRREVEKYKGIIKEYDVMNEAIPGHANYLQTVVGDSINWNSFKWARETDPDAKLYINDYNVISYNDTYKYDALIADIISHGAPLDGIGVQCHFGGNLQPANITSKLNTLSKHGLPIKVTEFDMAVADNNMSEQAQANYYAQAMRTFFSHPNVNGFMFWGFWDKRHWRDGAGLFNEDKSAKLVVDSVYHLIHEVWSSKGELSLNQMGNQKINVYYGTYRMNFEHAGLEKEIIVPLRKANKGETIRINLKDALSPAPRIISVKALDQKYISITFDRKVKASRSTHSSFKVFDEYKKTTLTVKQPSNDSTKITLLMKDKMVASDKFILSYVPGNVVGENGIHAEFYPPTQMENLIADFKSAYSDKDGKSISVVMTQHMQIPDENEAESFIVKINDQMQTVTGIALKPTNPAVVTLFLEGTIRPSDNVSVMLSSTNDLMSVYGGDVGGFSTKDVINNSVVSAIQSNAIDELSCYFKKADQQIVVDAGPMTAKERTLSLIDISGRVLFEGTIHRNETLNISTISIPVGLVLLQDKLTGNIHKIVIH